jgi:uncharacterized protein YqeY
MVGDWTQCLDVDHEATTVPYTEREEITILNEFLPKGPTDSKIEAIKAAIAKTWSRR